jgi:hypothetical protein
LNNVNDNQALGKGGEAIAEGLLKKALHCSATEPKPDVGTDFIVEFQSPYCPNALLHLGVQVKTGFSFCKDLGNRFKFHRITKSTISDWHKTPLPILFVWVHPEKENSAYWHFCDPKQPTQQIVIPKSRKITPCTKYDIARKLISWKLGRQVQSGALFAPPLKTGIRDAAKIYYKSLKNRAKPINPLLGPVDITWRGWRHITNQKRSGSDISQSLQLLPVLKYTIENSLPNPRLGLRKCIAPRGEWCHERRLLVFRAEIPLQRRADASVECILRETISYKKNWHSVPNGPIKTQVSFESLSET